jgi:predicted DsbA family dithiol-disulfide isomerase
VEVPPNTIAIWSDIGCPWSHAVVWRLHDARRRLGLTERVRFEHHVFPLELFNNEPTPRPLREAEWEVASRLAPRAGWQAWAAPDHAWPVTMLPPMEAVQAAALQSSTAAEELDRGLRRAFWGESRCISLRHVILEIANETDAVDVAVLSQALDDGRARRRLFDDWAVASGSEVRGSAHVFAPDGTNEQNPGIVVGWVGNAPRIEHDDPAAIDAFLQRAANR